MDNWHACGQPGGQEPFALAPTEELLDDEEFDVDGLEADEPVESDFVLDELEPFSPLLDFSALLVDLAPDFSAPFFDSARLSVR